MSGVATRDFRLDNYPPFVEPWTFVKDTPLPTRHVLTYILWSWDNDPEESTIMLQRFGRRPMPPAGER